MNPFFIVFLAGKSKQTQNGEVTAAAVCASCTVPAQGHGTLELALVWDMPCVHFGSKERLHLRWVLWGQPGGAPCSAPELSSGPNFLLAGGTHASLAAMGMQLLHCHTMP